MCAHLRSSVARQQPLTVAVSPVDTLNRVEVSEIPRMLAADKVPLVKLAVDAVIVHHLELFAEHLRSCQVEAWKRVGTVLCHDQRLVNLLPEIELKIQGIAGGIHVSAEIVPAVIAVDAHDIHLSCRQITLIVVLAADKGDGPEDQGCV